MSSEGLESQFENLNASRTLMLPSLGIIIFLEIIGMSSLGDFHPEFLILDNRAIEIIIMVMILLYFILAGRRVLAWRRMLSLLLLIVIAACIMRASGRENSLLFGFFIGFACFGVGLTLQEISNAYFWGTLIGFISVILMAILGILPKGGFASKVTSMQSSYLEIEYFWGFKHPNAFGTLLMVLLILSVLAFPYLKQRVFVSLGFSCALICIVVAAGTAAVGAGIVTLGLLCKTLIQRYQKLFTLFAGILVCSMPVFSVWVSKNPYSSIGIFINTHVSSRTMVWNFYTSRFPIKLIANPLQIDLSLGGSGVLGNGVLDGSYIYVLLHWGILALLLLSLSWLLMLAQNKITGDLGYFIIIIVATSAIVAFPESHVLFFYENILCIGLGTIQLSHSERKHAFTFLRRETK